MWQNRRIFVLMRNFWKTEHHGSTETVMYDKECQIYCFLQRRQKSFVCSHVLIPSLCTRSRSQRRSFVQVCSLFLWHGESLLVGHSDNLAEKTQSDTSSNSSLSYLQAPLWEEDMRDRRSCLSSLFCCSWRRRVSCNLSRIILFHTWDLANRIEMLVFD